eukprot:TRINITY_DN4377_c0_g1_i1.p1 TRINITY_DN4377_c0_g1~~TRINITY_DN4377_c0_g1_i1.p1  ORF type:complete len:179 (+),score=11.12 TRINITY_DN4377_c0_g1_i1:457-993(+)
MIIKINFALKKLVCKKNTNYMLINKKCNVTQPPISHLNKNVQIISISPPSKHQQEIQYTKFQPSFNEKFKYTQPNVKIKKHIYTINIPTKKLSLYPLNLIQFSFSSTYFNKKKKKKNKKKKKKKNKKKKKKKIPYPIKIKLLQKLSKTNCSQYMNQNLNYLQDISRKAMNQQKRFEYQ